MQLTSQDKKAAREGFAYVVVRGGKRVCYASTLAEAKRECGSKGKVVSISGMRYTAQNPSLNVRNPSGKRQRARGIREGDATIGWRSGARWMGGNVYNLRTMSGPDEYSEMREYAEYARKAGDKKRHAEILAVMRGLREGDKETGMRQLPNPSLNVRNPSLNVRNPSLNVRNPAKQQWYLIDKYGEVLIGVGKFSSREAARKKATAMIARDVEYAGMGLVSRGELERDGFFDQQRNPSAAGVGHAVGKHTKYAARGAARVGKKAWAGTKSFFGGFASGYKKHNPSLNVRNPASKADIVALALAKVDKRAGQVTGEDNSIEVRAKRLRKSGYVVAGDPYGYGFPQQPKNIKAATILTEFKGGKVAPPSSSYSWSFDLNRELGNKAWEVSPINSVATLIFKW